MSFFEVVLVTGFSSRSYVFMSGSGRGSGGNGRACRETTTFAPSAGLPPV
ncbi:hypothetical protein [Streptomyces sp. NPDC047453]